LLSICQTKLVKRFLSSVLVAFIVLFVVSAQQASAAQTGVLLPVTAGNYQQWTPKSGSNHVIMVDEAVCNGTTDFNRETTLGERDSYGVSVSSIPNGATITQIDITPCASRHNTGGGSSTLDVFYRLNGSDSADAGAYALPTGITPVGLTTTSFASLSAIKSSSTTLEIGAVYSAGNKGVRLSQIETTITYTPLSTPSGLTASATGTGSAVALSWSDNATNEEGFHIERSANGSAFTQIATVSANVTTYNDPGLGIGTYAYRVRAYNSGGDSGYTNTATAYMLIGPYGLTASASGSAVKLNWFDGSSSEDGFKIERSDNGGDFALIFTTGANVKQYIDPNRAVGTYTYRVRAYKSTSFSSYSNTDDAVVLAPPSDFTAIFASESGVTLNWTDNSSNEEGFRIDRRVVGGLFFELTTVGADEISYVDPFFTSGAYEYRISAYKVSDISASTSASVTIP
jgi:hypothetical protein